MPSHLNFDTSREVERMQIDGWRRMSVEEKAALITGLTDAAVRMTLAGIRHRYPDASPRELQLRLAVITLGPELARGVPRNRRARCDMTGRIDPIGVHPPEDILLQKLRWFRLGGEVSDRQWRDVLGIVRVQGARLDLVYLRENAPILNVTDLLDRALREGSE